MPAEGTVARGEYCGQSRIPLHMAKVRAGKQIALQCIPSPAYRGTQGQQSLLLAIFECLSNLQGQICWRYLI